MVEPRAGAGAAAAPSPAATVAPPSPNQGTTAGARKRKAPATEKAPRKPRKRQVEEPIQIPVYYGCRKGDFSSVHGDDLVQDCPAIYAENICAHIIGELPLQPQSMSLVDLQLWVFKLFRLHPETQDLHIKGFLKQRKNDPYDEEDPDWYLEYYQWDTHEFYSNKYWRSFANKLKKKRNVTQKFMLYVESSEIRHYDILRKAIGDGYSQQLPLVLPGTESLTRCEFSFRYLKEHLAVTAEEMAVYLTGHNGEHVTPAEAWRARQMALEKEFGTFYDSYNFAPRLLKEIARKNPGGFVDIKDAEVSGCKDFRVLHRIFWAFGQCLQAFGACRPVLCIKGAPLCGKYQGVLLTAVALDANDFSIPVAFAIVECETKESWLWFLRNLERAVVDQADVCIIHDYKKELIDAVEDLLNSRRRQGLKAESRWCMEHLAENFYAYFGDKNLVMMFKKLCQQKRQHTFDKLWKELDELTSKYMTEKEFGASEEVQQGSVKHDEAELQEQNPSSHTDSVEDGKEGDHAGDSKGKITKFSDWIRLKPMEKWSLVHDSNGARYGIMGTDITDVYKNDPVLKGITCLPLSAMLEVTFLRLEEYFKNTSAAANKAIGNPSVSFPERVQDDMNSKMQKAEMHQVLGGEEALKFTVKSGQRQVTVNLKSEYTHNMDKSKGSTARKTATCSCNKPQLLHKLCSHVIAVCCHIGVSTAEYMSPYYSLTCLGRTRSKKFNEFSRNYRKNLPRYYRDIRPFERETPTWIPDKRLECGFPVYLLSDCAQTAVVVEEQQCTTEDESVADNEATKARSEESRT
ncbi:uncharacterized protein LOC119353773 [Triticum dicoccoides]|uniref:SWIM-type domain-containing protein n=1 Tax=Triticum turgidum subsp. durum TaxID=4567 RepID=A0A9R1NN17_TRITD|nr:uncharacterized protein LOC119353773 [Triticum dicoccoides]VAH27930.1 unnamed protein product [Triticum turgidum subsp. durum]